MINFINSKPQYMKRRDFIAGAAAAGLIGTGRFAFGNIEQFAPSAPVLPYDLVAVRGGEPEVMFDKAIQSLGGMKAFVKKGQKVVVKPNIGWDSSPERAADTNPNLVKRIVKACYEAGAKQVYVFDNTCDNWTNCYKNSGIEKAVKDAGGTMVGGNSKSYYHQVNIPRGKRLKQAEVHELILDSDVFINVPILKHHSSSDLTIAMKNLMGVVWDRGYWHRNDLNQCIADFATWRKPTLNIVDAYRVMLRNGPKGVSASDVITMKQLLISTDIVAIDAAATKIWDPKKDPAKVKHIALANELKAGNMNLAQLRINRIKL